MIDTHCHLDHTAGNVVFADVPIIAHDKTLAAMHANLGARNGPHWAISDYPTKIKMLFGQNLFELVPESDPAQAWWKTCPIRAFGALALRRPAPGRARRGTPAAPG